MFTCETHRRDALTVVAVSGDVDLASSDQLWTAIHPHLVRAGWVVLDCSRIDFIDSMGLSALIRAQYRADDVGMSFALASVSPAVQHTLELAGVADLFVIVSLPGAKTPATR